MPSATLELPPPVVPDAPVTPMEQAPGQIPPAGIPPAGELVVGQQQAPDALTQPAISTGNQSQQEQPGGSVENSTAEQQKDPDAEQVQLLQGVIDDIANSDGALSEGTRSYLRSGGNINTALAEIEVLRANDPTSVENAMIQARKGFSESFSHHKKHKEKIQKAKEQYATALVQLIQSKTPEGSKPAQAAQETSTETVDPKEQISKELAIVSDTVLAERVKLKEEIENSRSGHLISRLLKNKKVRLGVLGGVVASAITAHFGIVPSGIEAEYLEHGLSAMSTFVFTRDSQKEGYRHISERLQSRKATKHQSSLSQDPDKAGFIDSTVKLSLEHPAQHQVEHKKADVSSYVGDVLISHGDEIKAASEDIEKSPELVAELIQKLVFEEVTHLHAKVITNRRRAKVFEALAIAVSVSPASSVSDAMEDIAQTGEDSQELFSVDQ